MLILDRNIVNSQNNGKLITGVLLLLLTPRKNVIMSPRQIMCTLEGPKLNVFVEFSLFFIPPLDGSALSAI
jgi:hypothetical protein